MSFSALITSSRHHVITQQITLIGRTTANQAASKDKAGGMGKKQKRKTPVSTGVFGFTAQLSSLAQIRDLSLYWLMCLAAYLVRLTT